MFDMSRVTLRYLMTNIIHFIRTLISEIHLALLNILRLALILVLFSTVIDNLSSIVNPFILYRTGRCINWLEHPLIFDLALLVNFRMALRGKFSMACHTEFTMAHIFVFGFTYLLVA